MRAIELGEGNLGAVLGLIRAQAGDPCLRAGERALERRDLARMATGAARGGRRAKAVAALPVDQRFEFVPVRNDGADAAAVAAFGLGPDVMRFRKQAASVEGDDVDSLADRLIFEPEAGGEDERPANGGADRCDALEQIERGGGHRQPARQGAGVVSIRGWGGKSQGRRTLKTPVPVHLE